MIVCRDSSDDESLVQRQRTAGCTHLSLSVAVGHEFDVDVVPVRQIDLPIQVVDDKVLAARAQSFIEQRQMNALVAAGLSVASAQLREATLLDELRILAPQRWRDSRTVDVVRAEDDRCEQETNGGKAKKRCRYGHFRIRSGSANEAEGPRCVGALRSDVCAEVFTFTGTAAD